MTYYNALAAGVDEVREVVRAIVSGLIADGFSPEQARAVVAGSLAQNIPKADPIGPAPAGVILKGYQGTQTIELDNAWVEARKHEAREIFRTNVLDWIESNRKSKTLEDLRDVLDEGLEL